MVVSELDDMDTVATKMREILDAGGSCNVKITKINENRTPSQNAALHLWLTQMAEAMNDGGFTHRKLWDNMKDSFDIPVTMEMLKDIAQNVSVDLFNEKHTSKLTTVQFSKLHEVLNDAFGRSVGISMPFPTNEERP